jgi:hypothetical protein
MILILKVFTYSLIVFVIVGFAFYIRQIYLDRKYIETIKKEFQGRDEDIDDFLKGGN